MSRYIDERNTQVTPQGFNAETEKIANTQQDHLSRKAVDGPNQMETTLDMNSERIINLPAPQSDSEPLTFGAGKQILDDSTAQANRAEQEADRAESEADRSESEANSSAVSAQTALAAAASASRGGKVNPLAFIKQLSGAQAPEAGEMFQVQSFWPDLKLGGGLFVWNPDRPKADHNGGTVVDPDKLSELGVVSDIDPFNDYFTPAIEGFGCFEVNSKNTFDQFDFGALSYPVNSYKAIQAAADSISTLFLTDKILCNGKVDISKRGFKLVPVKVGDTLPELVREDWSDSSDLIEILSAGDDFVIDGRMYITGNALPSDDSPINGILCTSGANNTKYKGVYFRGVHRGLWVADCDFYKTEDCDFSDCPKTDASETRGYGILSNNVKHCVHVNPVFHSDVERHHFYMGAGSIKAEFYSPTFYLPSDESRQQTVNEIAVKFLNCPDAEVTMYSPHFIGGQNGTRPLSCVWIQNDFGNLTLVNPTFDRCSGVIDARDDGRSILGKVSLVNPQYKNSLSVTPRIITANKPGKYLCKGGKFDSLDRFLTTTNGENVQIYADGVDFGAITGRFISSGSNEISGRVEDVGIDSLTGAIISGNATSSRIDFIDCRGQIESQGSATIASGQSRVFVNHNLRVNSESVIVAQQVGSADVPVPVSATMIAYNNPQSFYIYVDQDATQDLSYRWRFV